MSNLKRMYALLAVVAVTLITATGCSLQSNAEGTAPTEAVEASASTDGAAFDTADRFALAGEPLKGAENGVVTIIEFSDYQCPYCSRVNPTIAQLLEEFPTQVRVIFKQMPLGFHQQAHLAAQASLAAHAQGQFWEYHDLLFANQRALERPQLEEYAEQLGLDMEAFRAALDNETYKQAVDDDIALSTSIGIRGTPNFLVNGIRVTGAQPFDAFAGHVRSEIEAMDALIPEGKTLSEAYDARLAANFTEQPAPPPAAQQRQARPTPDPEAVLSVPVGQSPSKGGDNALVTIVEFSEFQCPFCSRIGPTFQQVLDTYGDDVRIVFKHLPLPFHDNAEPAAHAAVAAQNQGKFWEYHDVLFQNQRALSREDLERYAQELGLNMDRFRADMDSPETAARVEADKALATRLAARGTPHSFVNGIRVTGAQGFAAFQTVIDAQLEIARAAIAGGASREGIYEHLQADAITGPAPMIQPPAAPAAAAAPAANPEPVVIPVPDSAASMGSPDAPVTIVEYSDFQCPYCTRFANNLEEAVEGYEEGQVRVVFKHFPLGFHQQAQLAAEAATAANAQGKFWEYHDLLFANQRALERPQLEQYAEQLGLNMTDFRAALDNRTYQAQVAAEMAEGQGFGVTGTPAWFVNGVRFSGARPVEAIRAEIDRALEAAE